MSYTIEQCNHLLGTRQHRKATTYATLDEAKERAELQSKRFKSFVSVNVLDPAGSIVATYKGLVGAHQV